MITLDQETIRTLITAVSAVLSTGVVALFGWLSLTRREKLEAVKTENLRLRRELISVYRQFSDLYQCENLMLEMLQDTGKGNSLTLKKEFRKKVGNQYDRKIMLTTERCSLRITELENK